MDSLGFAKEMEKHVWKKEVWSKWRQKMRAFVEPLRITMLLKYPCKVRKLAVSRFAATKSHKTSAWFEAVLLKGSSCISWPGFWNVFGKKSPTKLPTCSRRTYLQRTSGEPQRAQQGLDKNYTSPQEGVMSAQGPSFTVLSYFSLCSLYQLLFFLKVGWVRKLLTLLFLPSVFIWASLIGLNPATTNFLGTFDCYEMQWLSQATSKKEHILFVYWNLVNQGREKKASERTHPTWKLSPSLWP